jgi:putative ABC transport system substrate-binding protein
MVVRCCAGARCSVRLDSPPAILHRGAHAADRADHPVVNRRTFLCGLTLGTLTTPFVGEAQQTRKIPRVGVLAGQSPNDSPAPPILAFRQGLRELGYVEGQNIGIEWRWAHGKLERFPDLAAELVKLEVDIIVAATLPGVEAAQKATRGTIPIVMGFVSDPVAYGLVASLARPGGNITGLGVPTPEMGGKRLQLLREFAPTVGRVAVLSDPSQPGISVELKGTEVAARALGVQLQVAEAHSSGELDRAFAAIVRERVAAIVVLPGTVLFANRARIGQLAAKHRLPTSGWTREFPEAGCLMSYGANLPDAARRAAYFVDKILKGAKPGDLPIEQPTKFELVINLKTAKAIGLTIPQTLLLRADQVIE